MLEPWTFVIASHALAAALSLVLGTFQVIRRVRGDAVHKLIGRIWAVLMLYVAAGSFLFGGYDAGIDIFLRALAIWTLFSVTVGLISARRGNIRRHRGFMVGTYFGLIGAFVGVVAVRTRMVPSWFAAHPLPMSLIAVGVIAVAGFVVAAATLRAGRAQTAQA